MSDAGGAGIANYALGPDEVGGPAFAHAMGPAAAFWNPALLTDLKETQVEVGAGVFLPRRRWEPASLGDGGETSHQTLVLPYLYLSHAFSPRLAAGAYVNSPFGSRSEWGADWDGRYEVVRNRLRSLEAGVDLAWLARPGLSLGAGLRYLSLDSELEQAVDLRTLGLPDGRQRFTGQDRRLLWQLGLALDLAPGWRLGLNYRSGFEVDLQGQLDFSGIPAALRALLPDTQARSTLRIPTQVFAGLAFQRSGLLAEAGMRWEEWSAYRYRTTRFARPVAGQPWILEAKHWRDTLAFLAGLGYEPRPGLGIRAAYIYEPPAVPGETLNLVVTDTHKQFLTLGVYWIPAWGSRLSLAYTHGFYADRAKALSGAAGIRDGTLRQGLGIVSVSAAFRF